MRTVLALLVLAIVAWPVSAKQAALEIQFIGNMAFYITGGETAILTGYPYRSGAFGYMEYDPVRLNPMRNRICLITHMHGDHWYPKEFGKTDWKLAAPTEIVQRVENGKAIALEPGVTEIDGVRIEAVETPHDMAAEHYSYLIRWHGIRLYRTGDTETPERLLTMETVDVMFITPWLVRTLARQNATVDATRLILCHQKPDEEVPILQNLTRMKQYTSIPIPIRNKSAAEGVTTDRREGAH